MPQMTGYRFFAEMLKAYNVGTVFWMPAILKAGLMEIERVGGIKRVLCHSEKGAAYMADGYARASRRPGIAMCQSVGAANLASGLQDAYLAHSPVIAITGRQRTSFRYRHAYQEIDHWPLFEPVTKYNAFVDTLEQFPHELRQAFRESTTGTPGPVHLELPGIQGEVVGAAEANLEILGEAEFQSYPPYRLEPDKEMVKEAAKLLERSKFPVFVAGGGAVASRAGSAILDLAEKLSAPVAVSLNGKGSIPDNHPLAVGVVGTYSRWCANKVVQEADLVVYVGSQIGDQVTDNWTVPLPGTDVIQIDLNPAEMGRNCSTKLSILGDARKTIIKLSKALGSKRKDPEWAQRARQWVKEWHLEYKPKFESDANPIRPERLCRELSQFLPPDALLVSDTGHSGSWTGTMVDLTQETQDYMRCAGSLGWAFPASLGAKCAHPDRPVVCFTGDGGFWYHMAELETAARCGINTVTVINNNRSLNQDRPGVDVAYRNFPDGNPTEMWVYNDVDFSRFASVIGCFGIRVERSSDIQNALEEALASQKPAIIDVATDIEAFAPWTQTPS